MRQPEDNKTIDMLEQKRGRGRPRKDGALTPAQRAKRYRDKRRDARQSSGGEPNNVTARAVTKNTNEDAEFWRLMYEAQLERTVELEARIKSNRQKLTYAKLTQVAEASIVKYMSEAESEPVHFSRVQLRAWAYGIFSLWSKVTYGFRPGRDYERLQDLVTNNRDASR